jgi:hypothetical protein
MEGAVSEAAGLSSEATPSLDGLCDGCHGGELGPGTRGLLGARLALLLGPRGLSPRLLLGHDRAHELLLAEGLLAPHLLEFSAAQVAHWGEAG